jgi:hypothetical protein
MAPVGGEVLRPPFVMIVETGRCSGGRFVRGVVGKVWRRNAGLIHRPHPEGRAKQGVSKDDPDGGAVRTLWNVLRDAPSTLLRTRSEGKA